MYITLKKTMLFCFRFKSYVNYINQRAIKPQNGTFLRDAIVMFFDTQ